eukprot:UN22875
MPLQGHLLAARVDIWRKNICRQEIPQINKNFKKLLNVTDGLLIISAQTQFFLLTCAIEIQPPVLSCPLILSSNRCICTILKKLT